MSKSSNNYNIVNKMKFQSNKIKNNKIKLIKNINCFKKLKKH